MHRNLNFYSDSSNLTVAFLQVFEYTRSELSELGGDGRIIGRNKDRSRPQALDTGRTGEWAGDRL